MGGAAFPTKTATAPLPTATWFATIPDRLTMAWGGRGALNSATQGVPAFLANQWNLGNATLGGFITAPDGTTNTMQLIVEDTSVSTNHGISMQQAGGFPNNFSSPTQRFRLSGFFKAGARTRVALYFTNGPVRGGGPGTPGSTVYTVFDLAGGQIGVAQTVTNLTNGVIITGFGAEIVSFGNGVYRCSMDFNLVFNQTGSTGFLPQALIDAGSGTGAANFTYTGGGLSGVYGWKMSFMPAAAWGVNNNVMFDDFTSLSTIDVNNTGAPGFKWYPTVSWPGFTQTVPPNVSPPSTFSVAGSILTIAAAGGLGGLEYSMASAQTAYPAPSGFVGTGWTLPLLFEIKMAYNVYQSPGPYEFSPGAAIYWTLPLEFLSTANLSPRPPNGNISREVDMAEFQNNAGVFQAVQHYYQPAPTPSVVADEQTLPSGDANDGVSLWSQYIFYQGSPTETVVDPFDGNRYHALNFNQGNPPHSSPANWAAGGQPGTPPGSFDASQFHIYSTLILPQYNSTALGPNAADYVGSLYHFYDGGCIAIGVVYPFSQFIINPTFSIATPYVGNYLQTADGFHFIFIIGSDPNLPLSVDYARVMQ